MSFFRRITAYSKKERDLLQRIHMYETLLQNIDTELESKESKQLYMLMDEHPDLVPWFGLLKEAHLYENTCQMRNKEDYAHAKELNSSALKACREEMGDELTQSLEYLVSLETAKIGYQKALAELKLQHEHERTRIKLTEEIKLLKSSLEGHLKDLLSLKADQLKNKL
ncbi:MAG: hypothetical protein ACYCQI_15995 [Gammaproteobacteria bacterium]